MARGQRAAGEGPGAMKNGGAREGAAAVIPLTSSHPRKRGSKPKHDGFPGAPNWRTDQRKRAFARGRGNDEEDGIRPYSSLPILRSSDSGPPPRNAMANRISPHISVYS